MKKMNNKGFSIVEALIGAGIAAVFITGSVTLISNYISAKRNITSSTMMTQTLNVFEDYLANVLAGSNFLPASLVGISGGTTSATEIETACNQFGDRFRNTLANASLGRFGSGSETFNILRFQPSNLTYRVPTKLNSSSEYMQEYDRCLNAQTVPLNTGSSYSLLHKSQAFFCLLLQPNSPPSATTTAAAGSNFLNYQPVFATVQFTLLNSDNNSELLCEHYPYAINPVTKIDYTIYWYNDMNQGHVRKWKGGLYVKSQLRY